MTPSREILLRSLCLFRYPAQNYSNRPVLPLVLTGAHAESKAMDLKTYEHVKFELAELIRSGQLIVPNERRIRTNDTRRSIPGGYCSLVWPKTGSPSSLPDGLVVESLP